MEAKDTVMTWKQTVECSHNPVLELRVRDIKEAQAEISFKAGQDNIRSEYVKQIGHLGAVHKEITQRLVGEAKQEGRREVVEWLERAKKVKVPKYQLKEWGL